MNGLMLEVVGSYIDDDVNMVLQTRGDHVKRVNLSSHRSEDMYQDERFYDAVLQELKDGRFDYVYSANFFPLIARACHHEGIPYLAWHYDTPPHLPTMEDMDYPTNHICFFNRKDCEYYAGKGLDTVYYLPLAVNTDRLEKYMRSSAEYQTDISLVGQLYRSTLPGLKSRMSEYDAGWVDGVLAAQQPIYGEFFADEMISDERLNSINQGYKDQGIQMTVNRRQLAYSMATYMTYRDRMSLLGLLSTRHDTTLHSVKVEPEDRKLLSHVKIKGPVDYMTQMPMVFFNSRINLCPILRNNTCGVALRALDVMGCGGFLFANFHAGLNESFENGKELVMYSSVAEAADLADYYLEHEEERAKIAACGRERMKKDYRYEQRVDEMMRKAGLS